MTEVEVTENSKSIQKVHHELGQAIYDAAAIFETLENMGIIKRNGHHIRQRLAMAVQNYLRDMLPDDYKGILEYKKVWNNETKIVE